MAKFPMLSVAGLALCVVTPAAMSQELAYAPLVVSLVPQPEAPAAAPVAETVSVTERKLDGPELNSKVYDFGKTGTQWVSIGAGAASNGEALDLNLYGRYEYFIAPDVELMGELGVWNYEQEGKDPTGFNVSVVMRYHFYNSGRWSWFVDGGIGLLFSTDPVNRSVDGDEGTSFNFTPRAGGGFTRALGDDGTRLEMGIRWAHVSNARIGGNNDNPGRDSFMLYAGLVFPW